MTCTNTPPLSERYGDATNAAWATLCQPDASHPDLITACRTVITTTRDERRHTASAMLKTLAQRGPTQ